MPLYQLVDWTATENAIAKWTNAILQIPSFWEKQQNAENVPPYCTLRTLAVGPGENQWITAGRWLTYEDPNTPGQYNKVTYFDLDLLIQFDMTVDVSTGDSIGKYIDGLISGCLITGKETLVDLPGLTYLGEAGLTIVDWSSFSNSYDAESGMSIFDVHTFDITFRLVGKLVVENIAVIKTVNFNLTTVDPANNEHTVNVTVPAP